MIPEHNFFVFIIFIDDAKRIYSKKQLVVSALELEIQKRLNAKKMRLYMQDNFEAEGDWDSLLDDNSKL